MLIEWSDRFETGNALVDQQHQTLFAAINEFDDAVRTGRAAELVDKEMNFLASYAQEHFATEERLMMKANFPRLSLHALEHAGLTHRVSFIIEMRKNDPTQVPVDGVARFLADWLVSHILGWDMELFEFLRSNPAE
jgi:hemerythrin-like metal-binding protein